MVRVTAALSFNVSQSDLYETVRDIYVLLICVHLGYVTEFIIVKSDCCQALRTVHCRTVRQIDTRYVNILFDCHLSRIEYKNG